MLLPTHLICRLPSTGKGPFRHRNPCVGQPMGWDSGSSMHNTGATDSLTRGWLWFAGESSFSQFQRLWMDGHVIPLQPVSPSLPWPPHGNTRGRFVPPSLGGLDRRERDGAGELWKSRFLIRSLGKISVLLFSSSSTSLSLS